jgi:hypothetical protein
VRIKVIDITEAAKAAEVVTTAVATEVEVEAEGEHDARSEFPYHGNHACTQSNFSKARFVEIGTLAWLAYQLI